MRWVVNSQLRSRARAKSNPSLTGARASQVTMPALKYTCRFEDQVEGPRAQLAAHVAVAAHAEGALKDDRFVHRGWPLHQQRRAGLEDPGDVGRGCVALEGVQQRQDVHGVAERAHHDDAEPAPGPRRQRLHGSPVR